MSELIDIDIPYALEKTVITEVQIPVLGLKRVVTRSYSQVEFHKDAAGSWTQTFTQCAIEGGGQVHFPDSFIKSIPPKVSKLTWTGDTYSSDTLPGFLGVTKPVETLPERMDDPLVFDADDDGHPGVTVHLNLPIFGKVRLYLVQANHAHLTGKVVDGAIVGSTKILRLETRTLGASLSIFAVNPAVSIVEGASTFVIRRDPERKCRGVFPAAQ